MSKHLVSLLALVSTVLLQRAQAQSGSPTSAAVATTAATTSPYAVCDNPLFKDHVFDFRTYGGGEIIIDIKGVVPAVFPTNHTVCSAFAGQQSCCTARHLEEITLVARYQAFQIAEAKAALNQQIQRDQAANAANQATNFTNSDFVQDCEFYGYSANTCVTLATQIEQFQSLKEQFELDSLNCLSALENYTTGMLCFACTTEWAQYVHTSNSSVNINNHTCTSVAGACSPVNTDFVALYKQYATILQTIYTANNAAAQAVFGGSNQNTDQENPISEYILGRDDLCGGNITNPGTCDYYICAHWIGGLGCRFPDTTVPSASHLRRMLSTRDMSDAVSGLKQSVGASIAASRVLATTTATSDYTNFYLASGYDAVCVGSNNYNCAASASSSVLSAGGIAAIVVGCVVGAAAIVIVALVVRRRLAGPLVNRV